MSTEKYNGWTNYETWLWKLWIDNDQGSEEYWRERSAEILGTTTSRYDWQTDREAAVYELAEALQAEADESAKIVGITGPLADLLSAAIGRIDWHEIAESMIDDLED